MKTALVTGATSRLGAPLARFFARNDFRVLLHVHRNIDKARELAAELRAMGAQAEILVGDFSDPAGIAAFCRDLIAAFGAPDAIVNNASIFRHDFPGQAEAATLIESLAVHTLAPFSIVEAAARAKAPDARLDVFNILDQKLLNLNPDYYSYTLGKAALMTLTEIWRRADRADIRVFGLAPGLMFPSGPQTQERFLADSAKIPTGRATPPEQICAAIGFFLDHPDQPGQIWPLDGGEHLAPRRRDIAFE